MQKKNLEKNKGITLIALIITIIVMLILIAVTVQVLFGENGIITKTGEAVRGTSDAQQTELDTIEDYVEMIEGKQIKSAFYWSLSNINLTKLETQVRLLGLNTIYVNLPDELENSIQLTNLIKFCELYDIDLFALEGDPTWYQEDKRSRVTEIIDEIENYNKKYGRKIKGINIDIEFYLSDVYKNAQTEEEKIQEFRTFVEANQEFCNYANERNIKYAVCLPVWLNYSDESLLEELNKIAYDHITYMNYVKDDSVKNIKQEVELAQKYYKKIVTIAELQSTEKHVGLKEEETFYNDGLVVCNNKLQEILDTYNYNKLGISYHEYKSLVELIEREYPSEAYRYKLEIYPYYQGTSIEIKTARLIDENGEELPYITNQYHTSNSQEYIVLFFGLESGKQYTLIVDDGNYYYEGTILKETYDDETEYTSIRLQKK